MKDPIKVYDARWEVDEFSDIEIRRLFEATLLYGRLLGVDTIVLTRDARLGCARVMELGLDVALRMGFRVFLRAEPISTPQAYFTAMWVTRQHPATMGLAITASHNPAPYVGIKFTVPTVAAIGEACGPLGGLTKVRQLYHSGELAEPRPAGTVTFLELTREYVDFSLKAAGIAPGELTGLSAVLDGFHGSAGPEIVMALTRAGVRVETLRVIPNGQFPTGSPNPTSQGKMKAALTLAQERNCDAVFGIDGDGDRIVFGDRRGILTAGFAFVPILKKCLEEEGTEAQRHEGTKRQELPTEDSASRSAVPFVPSCLGASVPVLYDPKVSPLALAQWGNLGARPVLFRNGHSQIKDYMTRIGAVAAAEESGHYYHRITLDGLTISGENSTLTLLLFLGALKKQPDLMDQLWNLQNQMFTTGEFNYQFASDTIRDQALAAVIKTLAADGAATVTATPDGIDLQGTCLSRGVHLEPPRVNLEPGWYSGYLRAATNEKGVVRSYFSADDPQTGRRIESTTRHLLEEQFRGKVID